MSRTPFFLLSLALALLFQILPLPDGLSGLRPLWPVLAIGYWSLYAPEMPTMVAAWVLGLCCDVLFNSALGQHGLALVLVAFLIARLHAIYILFPVWQAAVALAPLWALYAFVIFWIDGITHHAAEPILRWLPVLSTTLLWPLIASLFDGPHARRKYEISRMTVP